MVNMLSYVTVKLSAQEEAEGLIGASNDVGLYVNTRKVSRRQNAGRSDNVNIGNTVDIAKMWQRTNIRELG
jgi:hypothetical protein